MAKAIRTMWLVCVTLCLLCPVARSGPPSDVGPFDVAQFHEQLEDSQRGRRFDTLVFEPVLTPGTAQPASGFPLIVFCHGFLLRGELYASYGEHLASHGFVVALPTLSMSFLDMDHRVLAADIRYVIDRYLAADADLESHVSGLIDESKIGTCGHSLGGKIALLEAVDDVRIGAVAALDPVDGGGPGIVDAVRYPSVAPELMPGIEVPLLLIGAELGAVTNLFTPCAPASENYQEFYNAANPPALEITQIGAGHGQYVDAGAEVLMAACAPGTVDAAWIRSSSAAYLAAFFQWRLQGEEEARRWLDARLEEDVREQRIIVRRK